MNGPKGSGGRKKNADSRAREVLEKGAKASEECHKLAQKITAKSTVLRELEKQRKEKEAVQEGGEGNAQPELVGSSICLG